MTLGVLLYERTRYLVIYEKGEMSHGDD